MSNVLVIHPDDRSTDFLKEIYVGKDYDIITSPAISRENLIKQIEEHDKIIMMGHGTPGGLLNPNYGLYSSLYIIDGSFADLLRTKDTISIWCNSDKFFEKYNIHDGNLHTGMIISECSEQYFVLGKIYLDKEQQLNNMYNFAKIIHECIDWSDSQKMVEYIKQNYNAEDAVSIFNRNNLKLV